MFDEEYNNDSNDNNNEYNYDHNNKLSNEDMNNELNNELNNETINNVVQPITNIIHTPNSLLVLYEPNECKFIIYNTNKLLLGSFTCLQIIKYLTENISHNFLNNIEAESSYILIETYVCKIKIIDDDIKLELINHIQSPFMSNLDMLLKLYKGINQYELTKLNIELQKQEITIQQRKQIKYIINEFIYLLLNNCLKLIAHISDIIKKNDEQIELRSLLLKHSVALVYKITSIIKENQDNKINEIKSLQDDLVKVGEIKLQMFDKINNIEKIIQQQNKQINKLYIKNNLSSSQINSSSFENNKYNEHDEHDEHDNFYDDRPDNNYNINSNDEPFINFDLSELK